MKLPDAAALEALGVPREMPNFVVEAAVRGVWLIDDAVSAQVVDIREFGQGIRGWRWAVDLPHMQEFGKEACAIVKRLLTDPLATKAWKALKPLKDPSATVALVVEYAVLGGELVQSGRFPPTLNYSKLKNIKLQVEDFRTTVRESGFAPWFNEAMAELDRAINKAEKSIQTISPAYRGYESDTPAEKLALYFAQLLRDHGIRNWAASAVTFAAVSLTHRKGSQDLSADAIRQRISRAE